MNIPNYIDVAVVNTETGQFTDEWKVIMQQLLTQLLMGAGPQGIVAPTLSSAMGSVTPPAAGGQIAQLQTAVDSFGNPTVPAGTILYDSFTNNIKVKLSDGTFHVIVTL